MTNIFFDNEEIVENDLYFVCYMIERVARKLHQRNQYVVNQISPKEWLRLISLADVLHCENPDKIEDELCETLDNYNCGAYYEPSYFIARAYINGGF